MADADRCVMCGEIIPEGSHICTRCWKDPPKPFPLYAIKHKATGRFVTGTDFRYPHHRQILSDYSPPLIFTGYNLLTEIKRRNIQLNRYTVVRVTVEEVR